MDWCEENSLVVTGKGKASLTAKGSPETTGRAQIMFGSCEQPQLSEGSLFS